MWKCKMTLLGETYCDCELSKLPNIHIEEKSIIDENGVETWVPGKGTWEPLVVDRILLDENSKIYPWLREMYNFAAVIEPNDTVPYAEVGLELDCGDKWTLKNAWPQSINFGDLDYTYDPTVYGAITFRFSEVYFESCTIEPCRALEMPKAPRVVF